MAERATLKDVALRAGVATTTVARVVNKSGYVAEETRRRVEDAIEATGYSANSLARSLRSDRSRVIGHLLRSTLPNPFFLRVARGVEEYAKAHGYTALTYNVQVQAEAERHGIETFVGWRADAIIFSTPVDAANVEFAAQRGMPVVQVERPMTLSASRILVRNFDSAVMALRHLVDLGHRRIAFVGPEPRSSPPFAESFAYVDKERFGAYRAVLSEIGASTEGLIKFGEGYRDDVASAQGHGFSATRELLAQPLRPTAIYTANDILAAGAMQAIYEAGLRIPRDISVIGFDDTLAQYLSPLLTTIRQPARRLGMAAAKLVIDQIEGNQPPGCHELVLDTELVIRDSTGPAPV